MKNIKTTESAGNKCGTAACIPDYLIPGTDFGFLNGSGKPILYKAGAEKLLSGLRLNIESLVCVSSLTDIDRNFLDFTYRCSVRDRSGTVTGISEGSSNSREDCFRLCFAVRDVNKLTKEQYKEKIKTGEGKWIRRNGRWAWTERNCSGSVIGMKNFIQKTAQRRAFVGAVLMASGLSDSFKQD